MDDTHSLAGAVPSVPKENAEKPGSGYTSVLPPALPGQRSAMRLLDVVDQLTRHVQMLERRSSGHVSIPAPAAPPTSGVEFLNLQRENAALKARQIEARRRLEVLLQRVELARSTDGDNDEVASGLAESLAQVAEGGR
jgi:hypothetical protein